MLQGQVPALPCARGAVRIPHAARQKHLQRRHSSGAMLPNSYAATSVYALDLYTMLHSLKCAHDLRAASTHAGRNSQ